MALNKQVFKTRTLTAIVFVIVMLTGLLYNHWSFLLLFTIIHFGCWVEYQKLIGLIDPAYANIPLIHKYGIMIAGWGFMLFMSGAAFRIGSFELSEAGRVILLASGVVLPLVMVFLTKPLLLKPLLYSLLGMIYISVSFGLMISLRNIGVLTKGSFVLMDTGWVIPLVLIAAIWINDTMAYLVGSFIGKTPFSKISPKKTLEGTIGGGILCIVAVTLAGYYLFDFQDVQALIAISMIAAIVGTYGDLLESKLKRMAGVKDSGEIMPGHGGFLDRFDSLLLSIPFVWLYFYFIG